MSDGPLRLKNGGRAIAASNIRAVFFDLDGTLYDRDAAIIEIAGRQFDAFRESFAHIEKSAFVEQVVALDRHGHPRTPRFHFALGELLGFSDRVAEELERYFRLQYSSSCQLTEDTRQTLETLRSWNIKLGVITNGPTAWQSRKIESLGLAPFFDAILISDAEGVQKPDARIFARAMERCGVVASESMFVGDHPEADIAGAKGAGLLPVWKQTPYWQVPDDVTRIDRLSEILPLLAPHSTR